MSKRTIGLWLTAAVLAAMPVISGAAVVAQSEEPDAVASVAAQPPASAEPAASGNPATSDFVGTAPPDGAYSAEITYDDLVAKGASAEFAQGNQGTWTWTFGPGTFALLHTGHPSGDAETCSGTYESIPGEPTVLGWSRRVATACEYHGDILWAPEADGIRIQELPTTDPSDAFTDITAYFDRVFVPAE